MLISLRDSVQSPEGDRFKSPQGTLQKDIRGPCKMCLLALQKTSVPCVVKGTDRESMLSSCGEGLPGVEAGGEGPLWPTLKDPCGPSWQGHS